MYPIPHLRCSSLPIAVFSLWSFLAGTSNALAAEIDELCRDSSVLASLAGQVKESLDVKYRGKSASWIDNSALTLDVQNPTYRGAEMTRSGVKYVACVADVVTNYRGAGLTHPRAARYSVTLADRIVHLEADHARQRIVEAIERSEGKAAIKSGNVVADEACNEQSVVDQVKVEIQNAFARAAPSKVTTLAIPKVSGELASPRLGYKGPPGALCTVDINFDIGGRRATLTQVIVYTIDLSSKQAHLDRSEINDLPRRVGQIFAREDREAFRKSAPKPKSSSTTLN
jgi:hypothetical protein